MFDEIKKRYNLHFPYSWCRIEHSSNLYNSVWIHLYTVKTVSEAHNNIIQNDMLSIEFKIERPSGELAKGTNTLSEINEPLILINNCKSYILKPTDKYLYCSRKQLQFRKVVGSPDKIIHTLEKFFIQLKTELETDLKNDMIHTDHLELLKTKLVKVDI